MAILLLEDNNWGKLFWNPCINIQIMALTSSINDQLSFDLQVWPWPSTYLNNVSNGTSTPRGQQLWHIILKSMHKCTSYGLATGQALFMTIYHLTFMCDLDLQTYLNNVSNSTSTFWEQQLCQIILKFKHKCTSYGLDKVYLWYFKHLTFKCDLDLQPNWTNVSNDTSTPVIYYFEFHS